MSYHLHHVFVSDPKIPCHWGHSPHLEWSNTIKWHQFIITSDHPTSIKSQHLAFQLMVLSWTSYLSYFVLWDGHVSFPYSVSWGGHFIYLSTLLDWFYPFTLWLHIPYQLFSSTFLELKLEHPYFAHLFFQFHFWGGSISRFKPKH